MSLFAINVLAWNTEVWIAGMPEYMIHLNGNWLLGLRGWGNAVRLKSVPNRIDAVLDFASNHVKALKFNNAWRIVGKKKGGATQFSLRPLVYKKTPSFLQKFFRVSQF